MKKILVMTKALNILLGCALVQGSPIDSVSFRGIRSTRKCRWDKPHQGKQECARRRRQLAKGQIYNRYDFTAKARRQDHA